MSFYIKTDIDIALDIEAGFALSDVAGMTIWIEMGDFSLVKTLGNGITQHEEGFVLSIARTEIAATGEYALYARITDQGGKQRGIRISPKTLKFEKFPTLL